MRFFFFLANLKSIHLRRNIFPHSHQLSYPRPSRYYSSHLSPHPILSAHTFLFSITTVFYEGRSLPAIQFEQIETNIQTCDITVSAPEGNQRKLTCRACSVMSCKTMGFCFKSMFLGLPRRLIPQLCG